MEATLMSISRWMDKKGVVHIHNGVLLSHIKEYIWICSNEADETGADYTEWSKPERKTPIQYTNAYVWNLERITITLYVRQQKKHRCIEQSFGLCGRGREWDDLGDWHWNMYNIIYEMNLQSRFNAWYWMLGAGALGRPRGMVQGGRRGVFRMGNTCIPVVDSCWCKAKPIQYCKVINLQLKQINSY